METPPPASDDERPSAAGCAAALAIGLLVVAAVNAALSLSDGRPLDLRGDWGFYLIEMLLVAIPFGLLALTGIRTLLPWLVGLALTLALWGYFVFDGVTGQPGANFGLGLVIILSPLIITFACLAAYGWQYEQRRKSGS